jgi:hypothetical protein
MKRRVSVGGGGREEVDLASVGWEVVVAAGALIIIGLGIAYSPSELSRTGVLELCRDFGVQFTRLQGNV